MAGVLSRRPSKRRAHGRKFFKALAVVDGAKVVLDARGAQRTISNDDGDVTSEVWEPNARLWANIGDRLVVCGPTVEETTAATVVAVAQDGRLHAILTYGALQPTTTRVWILRGGRASSAKAKRRAA